MIIFWYAHLWYVDTDITNSSLFQLYDLHSGSVGMQLNSEDGCPREAVVCGANDAKNGPFCGINGTCIGSFKPGVFKCVCKPGWRGDKCTTSKSKKALSLPGP